MNKATISSLKNNLSAYLRKVQAGHPVVIYDRDVPIARIERIESTGSGADRLAKLHARGIVKPPLRPLSVVQLQAALGKPLPHQTCLSAALKADRDDGR